MILKLEGHTQRLISLNFDFTYAKLISLSKDKTVRVWDLEYIMEKQIELKSINNNNSQVNKGQIESIKDINFI